MDIKERYVQIESGDLPIEHKLHQLLELAMYLTGRGHVSDDYTKFIEFQVGDKTIISDPYYGKVQIDEEDLNMQTIKRLIVEIKTRITKFDKIIEETREKIASDIFDKPLNLLEKC